MVVLAPVVNLHRAKQIRPPVGPYGNKGVRGIGTLACHCQVAVLCHACLEGSEQFGDVPVGELAVAVFVDEFDAVGGLAACCGLRDVLVEEEGPQRVVEVEDDEAGLDAEAVPVGGELVVDVGVGVGVEVHLFLFVLRRLERI